MPTGLTFLLFHIIMVKHTWFFNIINLGYFYFYYWHLLLFLNELYNTASLYGMLVDKI